MICNLPCGISTDARFRTFIGRFYFLKEVRDHIKNCLPCLVVGSFRTIMEKEIKEFVLSAILRILAIVCSWGATLVAFLLSHWGQAPTDRDVFFLIPMIGCVLITLVALTGNGPKELGGGY